MEGRGFFFFFRGRREGAHVVFKGTVGNQSSVTEYQGGFFRKLTGNEGIIKILQNFRGDQVNFKHDQNPILLDGEPPQNISV